MANLLAGQRTEDVIARDAATSALMGPRRSGTPRSQPLGGLATKRGNARCYQRERKR